MSLIMDNTLMIWRWRYSRGWGAAAEWTTVAVYGCSQPLYHQLYRVSNDHRAYRSQPLPVRLLARHLSHNIHSASHCRRRCFNVGGRSCPRLTKPSRLVVALLRHQDSEVSVGLQCRLPLHHPLHRRRHAAAVHHHHRLLLENLRLYSTCQAAHSPSTNTGKIRQRAFRFTEECLYLYAALLLV